MVLSAGTRLGPYEILAPLGAGGMGEVYRAKDTRLDRTVAIKILPEHLSSNQNLRDRFEREARAVSALNHPSICTLHDVGHQDGVHFLVMEYIEGETLAHRLEKGPIPLDQTLRYGVQIANALDKAHKQGVVHRDLKPGNIMITKSGIKLLDFGLAKSSVQSGVLSQQDNLSGFATEARQLTAEGMIIGTLQYMSPEQLEGKETDTRTDIFAFGTVLYEMVTGKKAFTGKSQASLISAILKDDPVPISQVQPLAPPGLDRVVKTCLAKDPDDRWQSAHDVATELMWNVEQTSQSSAGRIKQSGSNRWAWAIASLLLLTTVLAVLYAKYSDRSDQKQELSIFSIAPPPGYTFNPDSCFAISPDGRKLTFSASDKEGRLFLWLRDFGSPESKKLISISVDTFEPFWSPDSRSIGIVSEGKLRRLDLDSNRSHAICATPRLLGGTWNGDVIIFANRVGLFKVNSIGGAPTLIVSSDKSRQETVSYPWFLPDGRHFLYVVDSSVADKSGIYAGSLNSKERKRILPIVSRIYFVSPGYLIVTEGNALIAVPFDAAKLQINGKAFPIIQNEFEGNLFSVSSKGLLGYSNSGFSKRQLLWLDRMGRRISQLGDVGLIGEPVFSPDESKIVFQRKSERGIMDLWLMDSLQGGSSRFTFNSSSTSEVGTPAWSHDGKNIVYSSGQGPQIDLFLKAADGSKKEELLFENSTRKWVEDWSSDGRYLVYFQVDTTDGNYDLWILPMIGDRKPGVYLKTVFNENHSVISPDGRWLAYTSDETGRPEVYVRTFPDPNQGKWQISTSGGDQARWRRDGKELYFMASDKRLVVVPIEPGENFKPGSQAVLFRAPVGYNDQNRDRNQYLPSADGQRFLIVSTETGDQPPLINVMLNWPLLIKK